MCASLENKFYAIKPVALDAPSLSYVNLSNLLFTQREEVLDWITSHSGNAAAIARYQARLEELDATLASLGLMKTASDRPTPFGSRPAKSAQSAPIDGAGL